MSNYHTARHIYGASGAALAVYASVMFAVIYPGFGFDTWWNAAVVTNFLVGMIASLPLAVMWPMLEMFNDPATDYMFNYVFFFIAFINSWHLISSFWISVAFMILSFSIETDSWKEMKIREQS